MGRPLMYRVTEARFFFVLTLLVLSSSEALMLCASNSPSNWKIQEKLFGSKHAIHAIIKSCMLLLILFSVCKYTD